MYKMCMLRVCVCVEMDEIIVFFLFFFFFSLERCLYLPRFFLSVVVWLFVFISFYMCKSHSRCVLKVRIVF